jgi:FixJ family two-component response regulator
MSDNAALRSPLFVPVIAKIKVVYIGRLRQLTPQQVDELTARVRHGEPKAQIARDFGISRKTLYNYLDRLP